MCTAISYTQKHHWFGRNLDMECSYGEEIIITPRNFRIDFRSKSSSFKHYAIIGTGIVKDAYPLYYDASNEHGLAMAALRYGEAKYANPISDQDNIASFELILWVLSQCKNIDEVKKLLKKVNVTNIAFSRDMPPSPLHWIISDKNNSLSVECENGETKIYENPIGVLTNMPSFDKQIFNLNNYINLTANHPESRFGKELDLSAYSRGMGALGLPGDWSSMSRFVRATFAKYNSVFPENECENAVQFFHILGTTTQIKGCSITENDECEYTVYASCYDTSLGVYYYKTYENFAIGAVDMRKENLNASGLIKHKMLNESVVTWQN